MELLEYQAKELFRMVGIPILPSQTIEDSRKIKQLQIPYPVVLKSQVRSGGRGKAGGVRFVANTIDAIAAARTIFNLSILGEYPEVILAEAHYNTEREFFLAIVLDYNLQCPVLLGSAFGGMNVDSLLTNLQQVVVDEEFSLFYARRLAALMGLSGKLICSVSEIIAKMYCLFHDKDLDLIEINPLGVNTKGELMALDGKITLNDGALARQPVLETLRFTKQQQLNSHILAEKALDRVKWSWLDWDNRAGKIAVICNSFDTALLTWDLFKQNRVTPACAMLLETDFSEPDILQSYRDNLWDILAQLETVKGLKTILINIWDTEAISREIVETVVSYCHHVTGSTSASDEEPPVNGEVTKNHPDSVQQKSSDLTTASTRPKFVLRLLDKEQTDDTQMTETIYLSNGLEAAIEKAIAIVKSN